MIKQNKIKGFTLIELMVAIMIFAIISVISYRAIASLVTTKEVVTSAEDKWGGIAKTINQISTNYNKAIPLAYRDENGILMPAVMGTNKLNGNFDSQLEFTIAGLIGDEQYGTVSPRRIGFRFLNGTLYLVTWPFLNRAPNTKPQVEVLLKNIDTFTVNFWYPDRQWRDSWPLDVNDYTNLPPGLEVNIKMKSGEQITRRWAL